MNRWITNEMIAAFCPCMFGMPSASAIRFTAAAPEIGCWGIVACTVPVSSASMAARGHRPGERPGAGMDPAC